MSGHNATSTPYPVSKPAVSDKQQDGCAFQNRDKEPEDLVEVMDAVSKAVCGYSKKNPMAVGVAIFFAGLYVGWKIKPW